MSYEKYLLEHFPGAKTGAEVREEMVQLVEKHGGQRKQTLLAVSSCADELNVVTTGLRHEFLGPFSLGGLAGFPFTGLTGMTAYAHHIPADGTAFIYYGPHIGISQAGELGKVQRPGQPQPGGACGALLAALGRISTEDPADPYVPLANDMDFQQTMIERLVMPFKQRIVTAPNPVKEITEVAYQIIHKQVKQLVTATRAEFHCARIILLGLVIINTGPELPNWVDVRHTEVIELT